MVAHTWAERAERVEGPSHQHQLSGMSSHPESIAEVGNHHCGTIYTAGLRYSYLGGRQL